MNGLIIRVKAYHGAASEIRTIPTRSCMQRDEPVSFTYDIDGMLSKPDVEDDLLKLIESFELRNHCKVNFIEDFDLTEDSITVRVFDIFEPSWGNLVAAEDVVDSLQRELITFICKRLSS